MPTKKITTPKTTAPRRAAGDSLDSLNREIVACRACPRLNAYRATIGDGKRPYCNLPVPSFGDAGARLVVIGLAPGAHGANRTGRPFTGDYAGEWLYRGLHEFGFATAKESISTDDGLRLRDAWITNAVRCVPPENKPLPIEIAACADFLAREFDLLPNARVVLALGKTAHDAYVGFVKKRYAPTMKKRDFPFVHGKSYELPNRSVLVDSYHTSRYNTSTRVLTWEMFVEVFRAIAVILGTKSIDRGANVTRNESFPDRSGRGR